jgi:cob(I)alamin adenosyltransferase
VVYISKVYTRFGDKGDTMLASGDTVPKDSARVRGYGEVDELNSLVGLLRLALESELSRPGCTSEHHRFAYSLDVQLTRVQHELFNLGAELATPLAASDEAKVKIHQRHIDVLETDIDMLNKPLAPLTSFVLPGGGAAGAAAHHARTVCRRSEREVVALARAESIRPEAIVYLNRLSDYFFVVARACALSFGHQEVLWDSKNT